MSDLVPSREHGYAFTRRRELFERVMVPLLLGGGIRPIRPIGTEVAAAIAALPAGWPDEAGAFERARVRFVRGLHPVDSLPAPLPGEWLLAAALNDLLQLVNPHLPALFRKNVPRLAASVRRSIAAIPAPATLLDVLTRAAVLSRLAQATRTDTRIEWWTGHAEFYGEVVPGRLRAWPAIRRVTETQSRVPIWELAVVPGAPRDDYVTLLGALLARSPLTDLATAARADPPFRFTDAIAALVASPRGASLARRALADVTDKGLDLALADALKRIPDGAPARGPLATFLSDRKALR